MDKARRPRAVQNYLDPVQTMGAKKERKEKRKLKRKRKNGAHRAYVSPCQTKGKQPTQKVHMNIEVS